MACRTTAILRRLRGEQSGQLGQATANRITQLGKNLYNDPIGTYNGIKDSIVGAYTMFKNANANEKSRIVGNIAGHGAVDVATGAATGAAGKFAAGKVKSLIRGKPAVSLPQALSGDPADTYVYYGKKGGKPVYVGITNDLKRRQMEHGTRFRLEPITKTPLIRGEARAVEQALINNPDASVGAQCSTFRTVCSIRWRAVGFNTLCYDASVGVLNPRIIKS